MVKQTKQVSSRGSVFHPSLSLRNTGLPMKVRKQQQKVDMHLECNPCLCAVQTADECKKAGAPAVEVYPCDVSNSQGVDKLCKQLLDKHKCMDVVVHSAGIFPMTGQTPLEGKATFCSSKVQTLSSSLLGTKCFSACAPA